MKPLAVVLAFEPEDRRQSVIADTLRKHWSELIKLSPADRKVRIDQLLKPTERK
ncbi:hypothetical protein [Bradyrhizobium yuanmingense]|nr:hypothetical protein [Bradyrhizobium yuanmingense]